MPDFRFKSQFPVAQVAQLIADKKMKEQQMELAKKQDRRQRLDSLLNALTTSAQLARSFQDMKSQRMAQQQAQSQMSREQKLAGIMAEPQASAPVSNPIQQFGRPQLTSPGLSDMREMPDLQRTKTVQPTFGQTAAYNPDTNSLLANSASQPQRLDAALAGAYPEQYGKAMMERKFAPKKTEDEIKTIEGLMVQAIKSGDIEKAKKLASLKDLTSTNTSTVSPETTEYRKTKIEESKERAREGLVARFNAEPSIRKNQQSLEFSSNVLGLVASGNPIADAAVPTYMARASGEVGNLSEADKAPFGSTRAILGKIEQSLKQAVDGKLTDENREFIQDLANTMEQSANRNIDNLARLRAKQYSKASKLYKEEELLGTLRPGIEPVDTKAISKPKGDLKDKSDDELFKMLLGK